MNDERLHSNVFELYTTEKVKQQRVETDRGEAEYTALEIDTAEVKQSSLRLHEASGLIRLLPYAQLRHVVCAPPGWLALQFQDFLVTLEGSNLVPAVKLLQTRQLAAIYCFTEEYTAPPEAGAPLVTRLLIQTYEEAFAQTEEAL